MIGSSVVALVLLGACAVEDPNDAPTADEALTSGTVVEAHSGTRLRATYWKRNDARVDSGAFRDTELDELCAFAPTDDGWRCLPIGGETPSSYTNGVEVFFDAECMTPGLAIRRPPNEPAPKYARIAKTAPSYCGVRMQAVKLGTSQPAGALWTKANGTCTAWSVSNYPDVATYTPLANGLFVRGAEEIAAVSTDLSAGRIRGEDGSIAANGLHDARRDTKCFADAEGHCLPHNSAFVDESLFADSSCSVPGAYFSRAGGWAADSDVCTPRVARSYDRCGVSSFFEIGARSSVMSAGSDTTCSPQELPAGTDAYAVGAPIALGDFPTVTTTKVGGVLQTRASSGGLVLTSLLDRANDRACTPTRFPDGKDRCIPTTDANAVEFSDADCTAPALGITASTDSCALIARPRLAQDYARGRYYDVSTTTRRGETYRVQDGVCVSSGENDFADLTPISPDNYDELSFLEESGEDTKSNETQKTPVDPDVADTTTSPPRKPSSKRHVDPPAAAPAEPSESTGGCSSTSSRGTGGSAVLFGLVALAALRRRRS